MKKGKSKFDDSFKKQLVELYNNGKSATEIELEYHVSNSALYKRIRYYNSTGSFKESKNNYGSRKIKFKLNKLGFNVSLRRIRRIMKKYGLVSNYTIKQFKNHNSKVNNDDIPNIVDRKFNNRDSLEVIISDLTYVRVLNKWCYVCLIIDLFNREIIGYSAGRHKNASIVEKSVKSIKYDLNKIRIFHSDRGSEFKNQIIEEILTKFDIQRSLSRKGTPYDNAVAEATYKYLKLNFVLIECLTVSNNLN